MDWRVRLWREGLGLQEGEEVLLLVDRALHDLGQALEREGRALGARPSLIVADPPGAPLRPVPPTLAEGARAADLILTLYSRFDLAQSDPLMALVATERRGRWAYGAGVSEAVLAAAFSRPIAPVVAAAAWWGAQFRRAEAVHLRSAAGTDLRLKRTFGPVLVETGAWGLDKPAGGQAQAQAKTNSRAQARTRLALANIPGGEAYFAPDPDSVDGWLVVDGALGDIPLTSPVNLCFQRGKLEQWTGDPGALALLAERFTPFGGLSQARLCEFGVGANPHVQPSGHAALDEKRHGTAHVALTDPSGRLHYDAVIEGAQIRVGERDLSYSFNDYDC